MCIRGELQAAESEIVRARELLAESARYAEGDADRVLGEIRLLRGDRAGAEEAFLRAHELGWHPLPGWALLQAEKGQFAAAIKSLQDGLQSPSWADGQRRGILLAHLARIAALAGQLPLAKRTLAALENSTELRATTLCEAGSHQAAAEIALAEGAVELAIAALRRAVAVWQEAGSRINVAHIRLRLGEILAQSGDLAAAELEFSSAGKAFEKMGAAPMAAICQKAGKAARAPKKRAGSRRS
jgi:tetratricopeptide (TPR) repeat protein